MKVELEFVEISSRKNAEVEQTGVVTEDHTNDMLVALKRGILSVLTST